jgi:hypothetical protein
MGADSAATDDSDLSVQIRKDPKVFSRPQLNGPPVLFGCCGSFRMMQLLMGMGMPPHPDNTTNFEFMINYMIPIIRNQFADGGFLMKEREQERGGTFIVIYRGSIFYIEHNFQVAEVYDNYQAVGSGGLVALGALNILADSQMMSLKLDGYQVVERALTTAEKYNAAVRHPFNIFRLENDVLTHKVYDGVLDPIIVE